MSKEIVEYEIVEYIKGLNEHIENMIFSKLGEGRKLESNNHKIERIGYINALLAIQEILDSDFEIYDN